MTARVFTRPSPVTTPDAQRRQPRFAKQTLVQESKHISCAKYIRFNRSPLIGCFLSLTVGGRKQLGDVRGRCGAWNARPTGATRQHNSPVERVMIRIKDVIDVKLPVTDYYDNSKVRRSTSFDLAGNTRVATVPAVLYALSLVCKRLFRDCCEDIRTLQRLKNLIVWGDPICVTSSVLCLSPGVSHTLTVHNPSSHRFLIVRYYQDAPLPS